MKRLTNFSDLLTTPVLYPQPRSALWVSSEGEMQELDFMRLPDYLATQIPLICHRRWTQAKIHHDITDYLDVLELFAFVRPARFCLPTPGGLAEQLGLARPNSASEAAITIVKAALALFDIIGAAPAEDRRQMRDIAEMMAKGGWGWGSLILDYLGVTSVSAGPPDGRQAAIWAHLAEAPETVGRGEPGIRPVLPDAARTRLSEMLGTQSEPRLTQSDYAAATAAIFDQPETGPSPTLLLSEAGTGTGKTLGYLAPASLWAEMNDAPVWVSTYTRTLQHQIADELSRLPVKTDKNGQPRCAKPVVIRKGRENYLCILNLEEALGTMPGQPAMAIPLGLMARWTAASEDGDLTGASFPAWLVDLVGARFTTSLADRRGECIHSACTHYHKCFVEKSVRAARSADIVVANHALAMIQAAFSGPGERDRPTRYIFDEGHHVFEAADSAFSAALTAIEAAEMRRWVRGAEDGRRGRARGLTRRLGELLADDAEALALLEDAAEAARILPGTGWVKRLSENSPAGEAEQFFNALRSAVYARTSQPETLYDMQTDLYPVPDDLIAPAHAFAEALARMTKPLQALAEKLTNKLDDEADTLDSQIRARLEGAIRGLTLRASGPLSAWVVMLKDCSAVESSQDGRDGFVDWMQIDRIEGQDRDVGLHRHHLDPSEPFAEQVLKQAHGVAITSATLRDSAPRVSSPRDSAPRDKQPIAPSQENNTDTDTTRADTITPQGQNHGTDPAQPNPRMPQDLNPSASDTDVTADSLRASWLTAQTVTGASHLPHPALLSQHDSPFDYARQTRIFVVNDVVRDRPEATAGAMASLMQAAGGGTLGLFTAIQRLKSVYPLLNRKLDEAGLPLYGQHVDRMNLQTLLSLFRADRDSCLIGTDAVRDGVDVPGDALRMIIYDRVPWPRPDMLFRARANWQGREAWTDRATRMKLRQAFGRLVRRRTDRGVFVMLDSRLPTRLTSAFPADVEVQRLGLAEAIPAIRSFLDIADESGE